MFLRPLAVISIHSDQCKTNSVVFIQSQTDITVTYDALGFWEYKQLSGITATATAIYPERLPTNHENGENHGYSTVDDIHKSARSRFRGLVRRPGVPLGIRALDALPAQVTGDRDGQSAKSLERHTNSC